MKKRILAMLLALTMVFGLLPATVFAAELTDEQRAELAAMGYDTENVMVVDENTVIDEAFDGLVVVVAEGITVTVRGAALSTGVVVLPTAPKAKVVLESVASVNAVILMGEKSEVIVNAEAKADFVTVAAPEAKVDVTGAAGKVTVEEAAAKAEITVAKAETVTNNAPEAKVDVAEAVSVENTGANAEVKVDKAETVTNTGAEAKVAVAEAATVTNTGDKAEVKVDKAETVTNSGAETKVDVAEAVSVENTGANAEVKVDKAETVSNSGEGAKVDVAEATTVTNTGANAEIKADKVETVTNDGENAKIEAPEGAVTDNTGTAEVTAPAEDPTPVEPPKSSTSNAGGVVAAPLGDHSEEPIEKLYKSYSVSSKKADPVTEGEGEEAVEVPVYDVVIRAEELKKHENDQGTKAFWVGLGIPVSTEEGVSYNYYVLTITPEQKANEDFDWLTASSWEKLPAATDRTCEVGGKTYNTVYLEVGDGETDDLGVNETVVRVEKVTEGEDGTATETLEYLYVTFVGSTLEEDVAVESAGYLFSANGDTEITGDVKTQYTADSVKYTTTVDQKEEGTEAGHDETKVTTEYKGTITETGKKDGSDYTWTAKTSSTTTIEGTDENTGKFTHVDTFTVDCKEDKDGGTDTRTESFKTNGKEVYKSVDTIEYSGNEGTGKVTTTINDGEKMTIVTEYKNNPNDPKNITSQTVNGKDTTDKPVNPYDGSTQD